MKHSFLFIVIFLAIGGIAFAATSASVQTPMAVAQPSATTKPTVPVVAPVATPQPVAPAITPVDSVTAGDLTVSHARLVYKNNHLDVFLSIKNAGKSDERLGGADSAWESSGVVQVSKDKDGKEQEAPIAQVLTAGKTTDFSTDAVWLRIKDVKAQPKNTDVIPVTLYFRRSPNAALKIAFKGGDDSGGSILNWFKK